MWSTVVLAVAALLGLALYRWLSHYLWLRNVLKHIPGPKQYPVIGISWQMSRVPREDRMKWFTDLCYQYKDGIVLNWIGLQAFISIRKPHQLEVILPSSTLIRKSRSYDVIKPWLGEGLITSTGEIWHHHRRLITPAFHFAVLEEYSAVMRKNVEIFTEIIEEKLKKNPKAPINIFELVSRYTLDTICETAMGVSVNAQHQPNNPYCTALHRFARLQSERFIRFWLAWDFVYYNTQNGKDCIKALKIMHDFTEKVVNQKLKERQSKKPTKMKEDDDDEDDIGKRKRKAFLDLLLDASENAQNPLSLKEIREEVDTFMFAGHDTTAAAISYGLFALGNAPEVQDKLQEELKEVFGDSTETATSKQLNDLKYLDRVIKEVLRLYPSAPSISRCLNHDVVIDGYLIPKDSLVGIGIYQLHHDPDVWPDPEKFDPDRFLPENTYARHSYAYVPFSAGPRNCIGQKFALLELKTALTAVLRKWRISSVLKPSEIKKVLNITLRPFEEKVELHFTPIDSH